MGRVVKHVVFLLLKKYRNMRRARSSGCVVTTRRQCSQPAGLADGLPETCRRCSSAGVSTLMHKCTRVTRCMSRPLLLLLVHPSHRDPTPHDTVRHLVALTVPTHACPSPPCAVGERGQCAAASSSCWGNPCWGREQVVVKHQNPRRIEDEA